MFRVISLLQETESGFTRVLAPLGCFSLSRSVSDSEPLLCAVTCPHSSRDRGT